MKGKGVSAGPSMLAKEPPPLGPPISHAHVKEQYLFNYLYIFISFLRAIK
jgi:hypothetical protein